MTSNYLVSVRDFGPIATADVEMRPLTVFIGPSNTGKSYLAGLLYALHLSFGHRAPAWRPMPFWASPTSAPVIGTLRNELKTALRTWAAACVENPEQPEDDEDYAPPLPDIVLQQIERALRDTTRLEDTFTAELVRCFGIDGPEALKRRFSESKRLPSVSLQVEFRDDHYAKVDVPFCEKGASVIDIRLQALPLTRRMAEAHIRNSTLVVEEEDEGFFEERLDERQLYNTLLALAFRTAFRPLAIHRAYYLPADRTGVMHSHHVVVSALVQRASLAGIRKLGELPMLSGVMADFLDLLVTQISQLVRRSPRRTSGMREAARDFERRILGGAIRVELGQAEYPSFAYRPVGWKEDLPLLRASSMVSELAPIVLYLRHVVAPGDVLIIEEPESHLHPAKQAALARQLAALVDAGVRVVITTHSEWFLEQIGNMIRAADLPQGQRGDIPQALRADQVGAWLFKARGRKKGSVVEEVKVDEDTGLFPTDYDAVSDQLFNESTEIYNRLQADESGG